MVKHESFLLLLAVLLMGMAIGPIGAQETPTDLGVDNRAALGEPLGDPVSGAELERRTEELTSVMRCPVCQGLSIADSDTMIAMAMKEEIRQFISAGYSDEQILLYFEASYGEFIRLEPKPTGFNLTVWIAPVAALLLGIAIVAYRLKSRPQVEVPVVQKAPKGDLDDYRARVRREISS